jgi:hypothetical protein
LFSNRLLARLLLAGLLLLASIDAADAAALTSLFFHFAGTNHNTSTGANWCTLTNGAGTCGSVPTAANQAVFDASSGDATIDGAQTWGGLTTTGYTNTLTHTAGQNISIAPGANTGSTVDFTGFAAHYTPTTGAFIFASNTGTASLPQPIASGGMPFGGFQTLNNGGAKWGLADNLSAVTLTFGGAAIFNDNGHNVAISGNYGGNGSGTGTVTCAGTWTFSNTGGSAFNDNATGGATRTMTGCAFVFTGAAPTLQFGAFTYGAVTISGTGLTELVTNGATFASLSSTVAGSTIGQRIQQVGNLTVAGACNLAGNSALYALGYIGWSNQTNGQPALVNLSCGTNGSGQNYAMLEGINSTGAVLSGTGMGNIDGNTGAFAFDTPITCYIVVSASGQSSVRNNYANQSGGTGGSCARVPEPQDLVIADLNSGFDNTNSGSQFACVGGNCSWQWDLQYLPQWDFSAINAAIQFDGTPDNRCPYVGSPSSYNPVIAADFKFAPCFLQFSYDRGAFTIQPLSHIVRAMTHRIRLGWALTLRAGATGGLKWQTSNVAGDATNLAIAHSTLNLQCGTYNDNGALTLVQSSLTTSALSNCTLDYTQSGRVQLVGSGTVWTCATTGTTLHMSGITEIGGHTGTATIVGGGCALGNVMVSNSEERADTLDCLSFCSHVLMNSLVDNLTLTGANTLALLVGPNTAGVPTITLPASTTTTLTAGSGGGSLTNFVNLQSSTAGTQATISQAAGVDVWWFMNVTDIAGTGGATFDFCNSSNVANDNTGLSFNSDTPCRVMRF